jgi:hypothetical protein
MREYRHGGVDITDKAGFVCTIPQDVSQCTLHNSGAATVYVGSESVSHTGALIGMPLEPGEKHDFSSYDNDSIDVYAVTAPGDVSTLVFLVSS